MNKEIFVSIVIPCLNEEKTIGHCVKSAKGAIKAYGAGGEVIVVDNDSSDKSAKIAKDAGAKVIFEKRRGYGSAYLRGLKVVQGKYIVMADGDGTYDFSELNKFVKLLDDGFDLVNGSRLRGKISKGAMPRLHRHVGVPLLTFMLNFLFKTRVSDAHCGMRAFTKEAYRKLDLRTLGMEFASEMIFKAADMNLKIAEVPISYYPREGESKLNSFRDAWRHIRFMLFYSPTYLFLAPGLFFFTVGILIAASLFIGPITILRFRFDIHTMQLGGLMSVFGFQLMNVGIYAKIYSLTEKFKKQDLFVEKFLSYFSLERMVVLGLFLVVIGLLIYVFVFFKWAAGGFRGLSEMRQAIISSILVIIGAQTIFSSFFISLLLMSRKR